MEENHPHIIEVITAFHIGDTPHILYRWATHGDLTEFWARTPRPEWPERPEHSESLSYKLRHNQPVVEPPSPPAVPWAFDQLTGVFDALSFLHRENLRHGDIRPQNMLIVRNQGVVGTRELYYCSRLVLADFGLTKLRTASTGDKPIDTAAISGAHRYAPPDVVGRNEWSVKYDVWSMGCVCLEFLVWLIHYNEGLKSFNDSFPNRFWEPLPGVQTPSSIAETRVTDQVSVMMDELRRDDKCIRDFLKLIRDHLLQIGDQRATAAAMVGEMGDLVLARSLLTVPSIVHASGWATCISQQPNRSAKFALSKLLQE